MYLLLNYVDYFFDFIIYFIGESNFILSGPVRIFKHTWDMFKFMPIYSIPFIGTPIKMVHEFLEKGLYQLIKFIQCIKEYNCNNKYTDLSNLLRDILDENNVEDNKCSYFISKGLAKTLQNGFKTNPSYKEMLTTKLFCGLIQLILEYNKMIDKDDIGSISDINNSIKTGNFAGTFSSLTFLGCLIYALLTSSFGGYKFS